MSYLGGKATRADHILRILNHPSFDGMEYVEPFLGYAHILRRVVKKKSYSGSDSNPLLMRLMTAIQSGEEIPHVEREEYYTLKDMEGDISLKRATAAFTYSYKGGAWKSYFHERRGRCYSGEHRKYYSKLRKTEQFSSCYLSCKDYKLLSPKGKLVYCDPPYSGTALYTGSGDFDTEEFWEVVRMWSRDNVVLVSEYKAPPDFICVAENTKYNNYAPHGKPTLRTERLFVHESIGDAVTICIGSASGSKA